MPYYNFAGILLEMNPRHKRIVANSKQYLVDDSNAIPDISITVSDIELAAFQKEQPHLTIDNCEYIILGSRFSSAVLDYEGFMLHASAIEYDGHAYLFSAPSGTGKSTHTKLWQEYFGSENTVMINDDKPILRLIDGRWCACGSPFCGKDDISNNVIVPIKGICFINRGETNSIVRLPRTEAVFRIFNQTLRPRAEDRMNKLFSSIEKCLKDVPVYSLTCDMSLDAVKTSYEGMNGFYK